jgi:hypothetical protein
MMSYFYIPEGISFAVLLNFLARGYTLQNPFQNQNHRQKTTTTTQE